MSVKSYSTTTRALLLNEETTNNGPHWSLSEFNRDVYTQLFSYLSVPLFHGSVH